MTRVIEAAGFLLFCRGENPSFLLMKHANRWDLPKGHAEQGESLLQTALRETEEETGIAAESFSVDPEFKFEIEYEVKGNKRGDYLKRVTYFLGYIHMQVAPSLTEHIDFRWFNWPVLGTIQQATIDPLLRAVEIHFGKLAQNNNSSEQQ